MSLDQFQNLIGFDQVDLDNISEGWIAFWLADGFGFAHPPPPSHPAQIVFKLVTGFPNQGT